MNIGSDPGIETNVFTLSTNVIFVKAAGLGQPSKIPNPRGRYIIQRESIDTDCLVCRMYTQGTQQAHRDRANSGNTGRLEPDILIDSEFKLKGEFKMGPCNELLCQHCSCARQSVTSFPGCPTNWGSEKPTCQTNWSRKCTKTPYEA